MRFKRAGVPLSTLYDSAADMDVNHSPKRAGQDQCATSDHDRARCLPDKATPLEQCANNRLQVLPCTGEVRVFDMCVISSVGVSDRGGLHDLRCPCHSGVEGCFLDELHAAAEAEFGVDVGQVSLYGAR
jgi:hypothetical protein